MIEDQALKAVVTKAIFDAIPTAQREKLLTDAVASLIAPAREYGRRTKLEEIFEQEVYACAKVAVAEYFKGSPEAKVKIHELCSAAITKLLANDELRDGIAALITKAIASATTALDR